MQDANRSIFRVDALQRYLQDGERPVLPRIIAPRTFLCLWVLLGLLVASGFIAWFTEVPVHTSGQAIIVGPGDPIQNASDDDLLVVALLPAKSHALLRDGQTMFLQSSTAGERLSASIISIEPEIISPETAQRRFGTSSGAAITIDQPAAVATARLKSVPTGLPPSSYVGSVYIADVEVGSRPVISLLPMIGQQKEDS